MGEPGWVSAIQRLLETEARPQSRYVSLATLTSAGRPSVRTVVFRGFLGAVAAGGTPSLQISTDTRSEKLAGMEKSPWAEVCWYFPMAREQFRLAGTATLVHAAEDDARLSRARVETWRNLSDGARASFGAPAPGRVYAENAKVKSVDKLEPPPSFGLILVDPVTVDHLALRENERVKWSREEKDNSNEWRSERVFA